MDGCNPMDLDVLSNQASMGDCCTRKPHAFYLDWVVHSFRITNVGVADTTQEEEATILLGTVWAEQMIADREEEEATLLLGTEKKKGRKVKLVELHTEVHTKKGTKPGEPGSSGIIEFVDPIKCGKSVGNQTHGLSTVISVRGGKSVDKGPYPRDFPWILPWEKPVCVVVILSRS
ncbi:hypothetical protein Tco_0620527 [Tanacetum coccineum]